jgi:hypothetical protein
MALSSAHEGYEYQDLLTVCFVLAEILNEEESIFYIDRKEFDSDKIDDLRVVNKDGVVKRQVKYSNENANHTFVKANIAANSGYGLSIDSLYQSWHDQPNRKETILRLCLAWNEPIDDLTKYLIPLSAGGSFLGVATKLFQLDANAIWPAGKKPVAAWRHLKSVAHAIDRKQFGEFCSQLEIEVELPKFSLDLTRPGPLEQMVLGQTKRIGIGIFPNDHLHQEEFIYRVLAIVRRARSKSGHFRVSDIFDELNIKVDYGHIEQKFPIVDAENIERKSRLHDFVLTHQHADRVILVGEPGSGKSWFLENLHRHLAEDKVHVIRHYCYTQLDDLQQKERIKVNTFYGNLIFDVLNEFPKLRAKKKEKFASNLSELNILLSSIAEPTWLIIDGLDHIDRIFKFRQYNDLAPEEIEIIENIRKLKTSHHVKILVASQNIPQLNSLSGFTKSVVERWTIDDINDFLKKQKVADTYVDSKPLSVFLLSKSEGNPLYVKYVLEEVLRNPAGIGALPPYSYNLEEYYGYLMSQLRQHEDVPQVLSGVNFSLDEREIREITHSGDYVKASLQTLAPVLKTSLTQTGFIIYHESFRRYMIDRLSQQKVSVEKKVFLPVIEWFDSKDLFSYNKTYRYCLHYYTESGFFQKVLHRLDAKFVTNSVVHGYPWLLMESNYILFVKAACQLKDFKKVVLLNELNKIISSTYDEFKANFSLHIEVVGELYGFNHVSSLLAFEDGQFFSYEEGLEACSICYDHKSAAPWHLFVDRVKKGTKIKIEWLPFWIRGLLVTKNTVALLTNAKKLKAKDNGVQAYRQKFRCELETFREREYVNSLAEASSDIRRLLNEEEPNITDERSLETLMEEIFFFDDLYRGKVEALVLFFQKLRESDIGENLLKQIVKKFKGRNWFFNWIIYYSKVICLSTKEHASFDEIKEAFDYLQYSTDPFLGKPRTCDLYGIHSFIQSSISQGLELLNKESCTWAPIIDILSKVSNETTTSIQNSPTGPLETKTFIKILLDFSDSRNAAIFSNAIQKQIDDKKDYRLHSDIADYSYYLALFYKKIGNDKAAIESYSQAVEYALSYTMRKDQTLDDAVRGLPVLSVIGKDYAIEEAVKVRTLVDSVVAHTDGKGTRYYPLEWFESLLKIDFHASSLYLLNSFLNARFDWRAESSLDEMLIADNMPDVDPVILFYLCMSLPTNQKDEFTQFRIALYHKLKLIDMGFADKLFAHIESAVQERQNHKVSDTTVELFNTMVSDHQLEVRHILRPKDKADDEEKKIPKKRKPAVAKMSKEKILTLLESKTSSIPLPRLVGFLREQTECDDQLKAIVRQVVKKERRMTSNPVNENIEFKNADIACYYWICRFLYDTGGWFERFINIAALRKAWIIDAKVAEAYFFGELSSTLEGGFNVQFSCNLLKALESIEVKTDIIREIWEVISEITTYRLPFRDDRDWSEELRDDLGMTTEEVLISMIISRYRTATTERTQYTTSAVYYLIGSNPEKLVKPLQWYFNNQDKFLDGTKIIVLQLLLEDKENGGKLYHHFIDIFHGMFPQSHYVFDHLLSSLLGESMPEVLPPDDLVYPSIEKGFFNYFIARNHRYIVLNEYIDMEQVFSKYINSMTTRFGDSTTIYQNNYPQAVVQNIYPSDFLIEIINKNHYEAVDGIVAFEDHEIGRYVSRLSLDVILAQVDSMGLRPADLLKPFENTETYSSSSFFANSQGWVRLGHYEKELRHEGNRDVPIEFESMGGIVFGDSGSVALFPYSSYSSFPFTLWGEKIGDFKDDKNVVFYLLQDDDIEYCNILWLNPALLKWLGLKKRQTQGGLIAENENKEAGIKLRTWSADYMGDDYRTSLSEMVPRVRGCELLMKKDYFEKLCSYFEQPSAYKTFTIKPDLASGGK